MKNVKLLALATGIGLACFALFGNVGLEFADEGFLWYGAVWTAAGEIPIRDFQAYDPGRYYWLAFWFKWLGDGILALRLSTTFFQIVGLYFGLSLLKRGEISYFRLTIMGFILALWMFPYYKIFDHCLAIMAVYFAVRLLEGNFARQYLISGIFIGLSAWLGRNHGFYNLLSFTALILFMYIKLDKNNMKRKIYYFFSGILIGYSPMLLMLLFIPGFFDSNIFALKTLLLMKGTNIPLPIPWPWKVDYQHLDFMQSLSAFLRSIFFCVMPVFYLFTAKYLLNIPKEKYNSVQNRLLIGATFVGVTYMHYAFSRADFPHLALGIPPLLLAILSLLSISRNELAALNLNSKTVVGDFKNILRVKNICKYKISSLGFYKYNVSIIAFLLVTIVTVGTVNPYYAKMLAANSFEAKNINGDTLWVDAPTANIINTVVAINKKIGKNEQLLIAPHWPGLYPVLERKSPVWEIYFTVLQSERKEQEMVAQLASSQVRYVILGDVALDGRDDLRFQNTHHLIYEYIINNFEIFADEELPDQYLLWQKSEGAPQNSGSAFIGRGIEFSNDHIADLGSLDEVRQVGNFIIARGWARNPIQNIAAQQIIIVNAENRVIAEANVHRKREDVKDYFHNDKMLLSGWRVAFKRSLFGKNPEYFKVYVYLPEENKAILLNTYFIQS